MAGCQSGAGNKKQTLKTDSASVKPIGDSAAVNQLSTAEKNEGWQLLFDGTTRSGWHPYNHKTDGSAWKISDGALYLDTAVKKNWQVAGGGDLVSDEEFENFDLRLDWKIAPNGNSGVIFYIKEDPKYDQTWHTGLEMQVLDNNGHPDARIIKHRAGDLYDLITSSPETVKPAGEWNHAEIISSKGALEFYLNGTKTLTTTLWDDNWKKLVAGSKFKQWTDFGTYKKGRIGLQDHGNMIWYRNIKIRKL